MKALMSNPIIVAILFCLFTPALSIGAAHTRSAKVADQSQVLQGYLVDNACALERHKSPDWAAKHGKACLNMEECRKSGYALLTPDQKLYKFDGSGNERARKLIDATDKKSDWKVVVKGRVHPENGTLSVTSLVLQP
jgi:hypothetical protein